MSQERPQSAGRKKGAVTVLWLLSTLLTALEASAQDCCELRVVTRGSVPAGPDSGPVRAVLADGRGAVYAHWPGSRGLSGHEYWVSRDEGASWATMEPHPSAPSTTERSDTLAVEPGGRLLALFEVGARPAVAWSCDQGRQFSTPIVLAAEDVANDGLLGVSLAADGLALACWASDAGGQVDIACATSLDYGVTWAPARVVTQVSDLIPERSTAALIEGAAFVALSADGRALLARSDDQGLSWTPTTDLTAPETEATAWLRLHATSAGTIQAVLSSGDRLRVRVSLDGGGSWGVGEDTTLPGWSESSEATDALSTEDGRLWLTSHLRDAGSSSLVLERSSDHGLPASWLPAPQLPGLTGINPHGPQLAGTADTLFLVHGDQRDSPGLTDSSIYLQHSCDGATTWTGDGLRLDEELGPRPMLDARPMMVRSASGLLHVFWADGGHAAIDLGEDTPRVEVQYEWTSSCRCARPRQTLSVVPDSVAWCDLPGYEWTLDGTPIPGATASSHVIPLDREDGLHEWRVEVSCTDEAPCRVLSTAVSLYQGEPPCPEPDPLAESLLFVAQGAPDRLDLSWQHEVPVPVAFNVLEGSLDSLTSARSYDHQSLACQVLRSEAAGHPWAGLFEATSVPGNRYFLITDSACSEEGTAGSDSLGSPRPTVGLGAACGPCPDGGWPETIPPGVPRLDVPPVDATTFTGKAMFGYQGWFAHPDDDSPRPHPWHWGGIFDPLDPHVEQFPDMRELCLDERYPTDFTYPDGSEAPLFSSGNRQTVLRHVKWLRDYNLDGVFIQRFATELGDASVKRFRDATTEFIREGCEAYGRVYAIMYDGVFDPDMIIEDWMHLVDDVGVTGSSRYLHHDGLPLVALWGYTVRDEATAAELVQVMDFFQSAPDPRYRANVMLGVNDNWFALGPEWTVSLERASVISPWSVGRYDSIERYQNRYLPDQFIPGKAWCDARDIIFLPVLFPGFSWFNLHDGPQNQIPRDGGDFLWAQVHGAINNNAESLYFAMFDEVDEATAFFKTSENASMSPTQEYWLSLDADGRTLPSDWYLRCATKASEVLRGALPNGPSLDTPPEGGVSITPGAAGITLAFPDYQLREVLEFSTDGGMTWPHVTADDLGSLFIPLPPGTYEVMARHGEGMAEVPLGEVRLF